MIHPAKENALKKIYTILHNAHTLAEDYSIFLMAFATFFLFKKDIGSIRLTPRVNQSNPVDLMPLPSIYKPSSFQ